MEKACGLAYSAGLRMNELCHIRISDVGIPIIKSACWPVSFNRVFIVRATHATKTYLLADVFCI